MHNTVCSKVSYSGLVLGDDLSGSSVLVSALLDDAFSSDASKTKILHNRLQRDSFSPLNIQYVSSEHIELYSV